MLTRAKIVEEVQGSGGYKWKINIPILYGKPDRESEVPYLRRDAENIDSVTTNSAASKYSLIDVLLLKHKKEVKTTESQEFYVDDSSRYEHDYYTIASVCGIPGSKIVFHKDDVVIVGFEENDMTKPVILGSLQTAELEANTCSKIDLNARSLTVDKEQFAVLPLKATSFLRANNIRPGETDIVTATQLEEVIRFYNAFNTLELSWASIKELMGTVTTISSVLSLLQTTVSRIITPPATPPATTTTEENNEETKE